MRLFLAIQLPDAVRRHLHDASTAIADDMDPRRKLCSWTAQKNLHLTLKFLGNVEDAQIPSLHLLLRSQCAVEPFVLRAGGLLLIPSSARARAVAVEVLGDIDRAAALAKSLDVTCAAAGFAREERPWLPHITIGRPHHRLARSSTWQTELGPTFVVNSFVLMSSDLRPTGPVYSLIAEFPFTQSPAK